MGKYKALIVDDRYDNQKNVFESLNNLGNFEYQTVLSVKDALAKINKDQFDFMFLDIQIPIYPSGDISPDGGVELLKQISLRDGIAAPYHVIGMTSHIESFESHKKYFDQAGWPFLLDAATSEITDLVANKLKHTPKKNLKFDTAILTALRKTELDAVLNLPCGWIELEHDDESNIYYAGEYTDSSGNVKTVVATSCPRMGVAASSSLAMKVCEEFSPDIIIMSGIAAGISGKVNIGDILVADPCWDWGSGKITYKDGKVKFLSAPHHMGIKQKYRTFFQNVSARRTFLDEIYGAWKGPGKPAHVLDLHVGPVATGSVVLEDPATVEAIKEQHREVIGVEMEGYGVFSAAQYSSSDVEPLVVKSVCDFADPDKNNDWQCYAAYTSAQLVYRFLIS
jgi:nucleoside phosphorylase/CheY-like chemotaxis protein